MRFQRRTCKFEKSVSLYFSRIISSFDYRRLLLEQQAYVKREGSHIGVIDRNQWYGDKDIRALGFEQILPLVKHFISL